MSQVIKLSSIKLFGKIISLSPDIKVISGITVLEQQQSSSETSNGSQDSKDELMFLETETSSGTSDNFNAPSMEKSSLSPETPRKEETNETQQKTLKKPDKILPCPRCNSMETKFCYFNNYNVNQPRHFCKKCQRYWTAGGVMRSVPIGSGRRKNKNSFTTNYHHIVNGTHFSSLNPNGFILFGSDTFLDESMALKSSPADLSTYWGYPLPCALSEQQVQHTPSALGKRSRNGTMIKPSNNEKENLLEKVSQTSSIWSALGVENERIGSNNGTSLFKAFVSKGDRSRNLDNAALVLQANPEAFSW